MSQFRSEAQRAKFLKLLEEGKIDRNTFEAWEKGTDRKQLLPRLKKVAPLKKMRSVKVIK